MRMLIDECVYRLTTELLRSLGHDVRTVQEMGLEGHSNGDILRVALSENRILVTNDSHFSNIFLYPPSEHTGIIVLKMKPRMVSEVHTILCRFLRAPSQDQINRTLVIVDRNKFRLRR